MKGVVITTKNRAFVKKFSDPLYQSIGKVVDGYIETVHPYGLPAPFVMIVNEEGLIRKLPKNPIGSFWYQTHKHGWPICGDVVVMGIGFRNGERDIIGLTDDEIQVVKYLLHRSGIELDERSNA